MSNVVLDDDFLDGCDLDFSIDADDLATQEMRPLFPRGAADLHLREQYEVLREAQAILESAQLGAYSGSGLDTGIAARLRAAGLTVVEVQGWQTRGSSTFHPHGSVDHHTGGGRTGNAPSLGICINGRSDLAGPLCNVLIGRDNTCYVIAAGRANHAGAGSWQGLSGNSNKYGVERENVGTSAEPWRPDQTQVAARVHAALNEWDHSYTGTTTCEHKEWAPTRKSDAHTISGAEMRSIIRNVLNPQPTPPSDYDEVLNMHDYYIIYYGDAPGSGDDTPARWAWWPALRMKTYIDGDAYVGFQQSKGFLGHLKLREAAVKKIPNLDGSTDS